MYVHLYIAIQSATAVDFTIYKIKLLLLYLLLLLIIMVLYLFHQRQYNNKYIHKKITIEMSKYTANERLNVIYLKQSKLLR